MDIAVEIVSISGNREGWITINPQKDGKGGVDINLTRGSAPVIRAGIRFVSAEFDKEKATVLIRTVITVLVTLQDGINRFTGGKQALAAESRADFSVVMTGSRLEIENASLAWDAEKRLPKKDMEHVFKAISETGVPQDLTEGVDPGVIVLNSMLKDIKINVG